MDDGNSNRSSRTSRSSPCVRNTTLCVVLLFVLMTCVIGLAWLVMNPRGPIIRLTSLSVSNFSVSDSELMGMYDVVFNMSNPNKKIDMFVEEFSVWVGYDKVDLVQGTVQEKESILLDNTKGVNLRAHILMEAKQKVIAEEWKKQMVKLEVRMEVRIRFEAGNWPPKSKLFEINCGDVNVLFFGEDKDAGKLLLIGGKDCCIV